ncbi:MAG: PKD domain-containing protein [Bacteroidia bacterium]
MSRIFFIMLLSIILIGGCKKEYPNVPENTDKPIFYFTGNVNYVPVKIEAGVSDYYMYSYYKLDSNNIYNFFGKLKQVNCVNCDNQIKFQINDYMDNSSVKPDIKKSFTENYYSFLYLQKGVSTKFDADFYLSPSKNDTAKSYLWDFGDGSTSSLPSSSHTYSYPGYYNLNCTVSYLSNCTSSYSTKLVVGMADSARAFITVDSIIGNNISLTASANGKIKSYLWDFGDGSAYSTSSIGTHTYAQPGAYKVILQTTDSILGSATVSKNISTQNYKGCATNFFYSTIPMSNSLALSNIIITWTDNSGIEYTSNKVVQTSGSYVKIVSVEDYLDNENKEPTKKIHIQFSCALSNGSNKITITNGDAVIAVSYPR